MRINNIINSEYNIEFKEARTYLDCGLPTRLVDFSIFIGKVRSLSVEAWVPSSKRGVRCLEVIPEALAAPMVVELWAQLLVVTDMRTGQHVTTSARISKRTD